MPLLRSKNLERHQRSTLRRGYTRAERTMLITLEGKALELETLPAGPALEPRLRELLGLPADAPIGSYSYGAGSTMWFSGAADTAVALNTVANHALRLGGSRWAEVRGAAVAHHPEHRFGAARMEN